jgi:hypothetical protein
MKNLFLLLSFVFIFNAVFSQIQLTYNGYDITNTTQPLNDAEEMHILVINNGSSSIDFVLEITDYLIPEWTYIGICTYMCFDVNTNGQGVYGDPITIEPGETYDHIPVLYTAYGITEHAFLSIKIYDERNQGEAVTLTLDTDATTDIYENVTNNNSIAAYPNPFNDNTTITFENTNVGMVNLSIYNSVGQEVFTVIDEVLPAGTYNKKINTDRLKPGIYFYNLTTIEGIQSKKMIKVN